MGFADHMDFLDSFCDSLYAIKTKKTVNNNSILDSYMKYKTKQLYYVVYMQIIMHTKT